MSYQIQYNKSRFPIQPKLANGKRGCRGCGGDIPKGRSAWCSRECCKTYHPAFVKSEALARDKGICSECQIDTISERQKWFARKPDYNSRNEDYHAWRRSEPPLAEYDHIIPFSEGGLTIVENIRTLCSDCHKKRTKRWHKDRKSILGQQMLTI